jgi:hypothetical protein
MAEVLAYREGGHTCIPLDLLTWFAAIRHAQAGTELPDLVFVRLHLDDRPPRRLIRCKEDKVLACGIVATDAFDSMTTVSDAALCSNCTSWFPHQ